MKTQKINELLTELAELDAEIKTMEAMLNELYCERDCIVDKLNDCDNDDDKFERIKDNSL